MALNYNEVDAAMALAGVGLSGGAGAFVEVAGVRYPLASVNRIEEQVNYSTSPETVIPEHLLFKVVEA